jgi:hypothetical protein
MNMCKTHEYGGAEKNSDSVNTKLGHSVRSNPYPGHSPTAHEIRVHTCDKSVFGLSAIAVLTYILQK